MRLPLTREEKRRPLTTIHDAPHGARVTVIDDDIIQLNLLEGLLSYESKTWMNCSGGRFPVKTSAPPTPPILCRKPGDPAGFLPFTARILAPVARSLA